MEWDKEPGIEAYGEVDTRRDTVCPNIPVMMHKVGDPKPLLLVKRLARGKVEVGSEAGSEGGPWEGDILGEVWSCVAALRNEGRIDL